jgi:WD40 repeat protein
MKNGTTAITCDGSIHVWDLERKKLLFILGGSNLSNDKIISNTAFTSMSVVHSRQGLTPGLGVYGDEQIIATAGNTICFYDFRCDCSRVLKVLIYTQ